jgi:4-hydroxy-tetrahydrodipicolinate reductase
MGQVLVIGAGRMGQALVEMAPSHGMRVEGLVRRRDAPDPRPAPPVFTDLDQALAACPQAVVLDFSSASSAAARIDRIAAAGRPLVEGTTGLDGEADRALSEASTRIPVVVAPNTSPGIALVLEALEVLLRSEGAGWDAALLDRHHRHKKDAPSGTAKVLASAIRDLTGKDPEIASYRQGAVVGEHVVYLSGAEEEIVLSHRALSRKVFARGALIAARFAASTSPGRYSMRDVLRWRRGA